MWANVNSMGGKQPKLKWKLYVNGWWNEWWNGEWGWSKDEVKGEIMGPILQIGKCHSSALLIVLTSSNSLVRKREISLKKSCEGWVRGSDDSPKNLSVDASSFCSETVIIDNISSSRIDLIHTRALSYAPRSCALSSSQLLRKLLRVGLTPDSDSSVSSNCCP